jgi:hypothetical protein
VPTLIDARNAARRGGFAFDAALDAAGRLVLRHEQPVRKVAAALLRCQRLDEPAFLALVTPPPVVVDDRGWRSLRFDAG